MIFSLPQWLFSKILLEQKKKRRASIFVANQSTKPFRLSEPCICQAEHYISNDIIFTNCFVQMRFLKPWRLMLYFIVGIVVWNTLAGSIPLEKPIIIKEWQSVGTVITKDLWRRDRQRVKRALRNNDAMRSLQPGQYLFSWSYSPDEIIAILSAWPSSSYQRVTILEWWNSRDVDAMLSEAHIADPWAYLSFISDATIINTYSQRYDFLRQAQADRWSLSTLEGFLYPETYMLDPTKDTLDQLVYLQLEAFQERVWKVYGTQLTSLNNILASKWYSFPLSSYGALILASVIEKEESVDANKPLIASIFFNRLDQDMRLDADITLCYGFQEPFETCTPERIREHLDEKANLYNTRANKWLPPTPISTVHVSSVQALFDAPKTDYLFYLHNAQGKLFPATTNAEHNLNKSKEL